MISLHSPSYFRAATKRGIRQRQRITAALKPLRAGDTATKISGVPVCSTTSSVTALPRAGRELLQERQES